MRVLFISLAKPGFYDAAIHRIMSLKSGLERSGARTATLHLGDLPLKKPFIISPANVPVLRRYLEDFDFIHAPNAGAAYLMSLTRMTKRSDVKIIYDVHGNMAEEARLNSRGPLDLRNHFHLFQYSVMEAVAAKHSDYFAVCSRSFRDYYLGKGVAGDRIEVILNGVDTDMFRPRAVPKDDVFTVTYAGRFQKWQGIGLLLEAARRLQGEKVRFRVIGLGPGQREALENEYKNVEFVEFVPGPKLVDYLCRSDALVIPRMHHPALEVAFPTKFAEYIACGVPVIVTDVGDAGQLTREHGCGLVCEADAGSLADAIRRMQRCGPEERRAMGERGRRLAEDLLDYQKIGVKYYDFLRRAGERPAA